MATQTNIAPVLRSDPYGSDPSADQKNAETYRIAADRAFGLDLVFLVLFGASIVACAASRRR